MASQAAAIPRSGYAQWGTGRRRGDGGGGEGGGELPRDASFVRAEVHAHRLLDVPGRVAQNGPQVCGPAATASQTGAGGGGGAAAADR